VRLTTAFLLVTTGAGCGTDEHAVSEPAARHAIETIDLVPLTTAQAARQAERIALVVAGDSRVVEGAPGTPFTRTAFTVQETLKGELPREFVLQTVGGRLKGVEIRSPLQPFARSRRYILFLGPNGPVGPTIYPQAVLEVKRDRDVDIVDPPPRGLRVAKANPPRAGPRLDDVLDSIRRHLRTKGGSR
jgi:hypothetical protein